MANSSPYYDSSITNSGLWHIISDVAPKFELSLDGKRNDYKFTFAQGAFFRSIMPGYPPLDAYFTFPIPTKAGDNVPIVKGTLEDGTKEYDLYLRVQKRIHCSDDPNSSPSIQSLSTVLKSASFVFMDSEHPIDIIGAENGEQVANDWYYYIPLGGTVSKVKKVLKEEYRSSSSDYYSSSSSSDDAGSSSSDEVELPDIPDTDIDDHYDYCREWKTYPLLGTLNAPINTTSNYRIQKSLISITLNKGYQATSNANRDYMEVYVAGGATISCWYNGIDALGFDGKRNFRKWPLVGSNTKFNDGISTATEATFSKDHKRYVYIRIPKTASVGVQAELVYSPFILDIEGREVVNGETTADSRYYYIYTYGVISAVYQEDARITPGIREWSGRFWENEIDQGYLTTDEGTVNEKNWWEWLTGSDTIRFLKTIAYGNFGTLSVGKHPLTGVAEYGKTDANSDEHIVTPLYLAKQNNEDKFLRKDQDDHTPYALGVGQDVEQGYKLAVGGDMKVNGTLETMFQTFIDHIKSEGADPSFENGKGIWLDALTGVGSFDGLEVRGFMRVMELVINRLQLMESDYSFTEGGTIEHVDYESDESGFTGRLILRMRKRHENDITPFYAGDIVYAKVNNLLSRDLPIPDGYTVTKNGSYYTSWMRVDEVDYATNSLTVALYNSMTNSSPSVPIVPAGRNFTPYGTAIVDKADAGSVVIEEANTFFRIANSPVVANRSEDTGEYLSSSSDDVVIDGTLLGDVGFDTEIVITRHGNVANGSNSSVRALQQERQQSWHLSTTDQRLIYYWRVDSPIVSEHNVALCLGMLPRMLDSVLPSYRDYSKPGLYISQLYYENSQKIRYPSRIVKEERGDWSDTPTATFGYRNYDNAVWTPDGMTAEVTLPNGRQSVFGNLAKSYGSDANGDLLQQVVVSTGDEIAEPYHCATMTRATWLNARLGTPQSEANDGQLEAKCLLDDMVDLETSRVWHRGKLWECLRDATDEEPGYRCNDWMPVSGNTAMRLNITNGEGVAHGNTLSVIRLKVNETLSATALWGEDDISDKVTMWSWDIIEADGTETLNTASTRTISITDATLPASWLAVGSVMLRARAVIDGNTLTDIIRIVNVEIGTYEVNFSGYVDVITVDDVGNCIGGIYSDVDGYRSYRIHSAITVRKNGTTLLYLAPSETVASSSSSDSSSSDDDTLTPGGYYRIYAEPRGCQCIIEDSTLYITHIDNIKDGIAGTQDDLDFDYDAMRRMDSCSVDLIIDCEGVGVIQKNFPVTIKHSSEPYVGADLTNRSSGISWSEKDAGYIGLPVVFDVQMWHNSEFLSVSGVTLTTVGSEITSSSSSSGVITDMELVQIVSNGFTSETETPDSSKIQCTIEPLSVTRNGKTHIEARVTIVYAPQNLPSVVPVSVGCSAVYAGVAYERMLTHTIGLVRDGKDATEVNPNILLRTIFDNGIYFVKEEWEGDWTKIRLNGRFSPNLLDPSKVPNANYYIVAKGNGNLGAHVSPSATGGTWRVSGYITVDSGKTYKFSCVHAPASTAGIAWYNSSKQFIGGLSCTECQAQNYLLQPPSSEVTYIRLSWRIDTGYNTDWENTVYFCENGSTDRFVPFGTFTAGLSVQGRDSLLIDASNVSTDLQLAQNIALKIQPSVWHTISFYEHSSGMYALLGGTGGLYDSNAGLFVDGEEVTLSGDSGRVDFANTGEWQRHTITFRTVPTIPSDASVVFGVSQNQSASVCMPKMETGQVATAYLPNEDDLLDRTYALRSSLSTIHKDYHGAFINNSWPVITAYKTIGTKTPVAVTSAEEMTIVKTELDSSGSVISSATQTSTSGSLACNQPNATAVRIEVSLTRAGATYATLTGGVTIIQEEEPKYYLECTPTSIVFKQTVVGEYLGTYQIACAVKMRQGSTTSTISVSNDTYDGYYLRYRKMYSNGSMDLLWTNPASTTASVSASNVIATPSVTGFQFALGTDSNMSGIIAEATVPVACDGASKMFYPMGEYSPSTVYVINGFKIPMVFYQDVYWYLKQSMTSAGNAPSANSEYWEQAQEYGMVITEGLFARYAKLGSAIMCGNFILSQNGCIGGEPYNDGANYGNAPAYTCFNENDPDGQIYPDVSFVPNWWVNLLTGKMSAARGNFVVDANGDVSVNGKIQTQGASAHIDMHDGVIEFFGEFLFPNIKLGVDADGCAVLKFYDKNGVFKYDLGPDGISQSLNNVDGSFVSYGELAKFDDYNANWSVAVVRSMAVRSGINYYRFDEGYTYLNNVKTYDFGGNYDNKVYDGNATIRDNNHIRPADSVSLILAGYYLGKALQFANGDIYRRSVFQVAGDGNIPRLLGHYYYYRGSTINNTYLTDAAGQQLDCNSNHPMSDYIQDKPSPSPDA